MSDDAIGFYEPCFHEGSNTCPFCRHEDHISSGLTDDLPNNLNCVGSDEYAHEERLWTCEKCGKEYAVLIQIAVVFSVRKLTEKEVEEGTDFE